MQPDVAIQFDALWESSDSPPDVFAFLRQHHVLSTSSLLDVVLLDQQRRWKTVRPLKVEDYLARLPELASNDELKFRLVLGEFRARQNHGGQNHGGQNRGGQNRGGQNRGVEPSFEEFSSRFSEFRELLWREVSSAAKDVTLVADAPATCQVPSGDEYLSETSASDSFVDRPEIRYRPERVLGEGGYGRVYLAFDKVLCRQVAVKVPTTKRFQSSEDAEAYVAEARMVASLDHPNIVPVYDVGHSGDGSVYVVSKFIEGCTLTELMKVNRPSPSEAAKLVADVALGLHHAHQRRIIHRDIKPGNILLEESTGRVYLADFGLAVREEDYLRDGRVVGTPDYMSPEQARGEGHRLDARSDIYSLGVVLYELLTGKRPFRGSTKQEILYQSITAEPASPRSLDHSIPRELERICVKAMSKRASDRYHTAIEFANDLLDWRKGPEQTSRELQIVPKGLRSFDADDADFFLDLLPGPRSRSGLPESIRFWKTRIEETDSDRTFTVGLVYGPSGCGKSSMVKAGLLPRLSGDVNAVYLEATPHETEARILRGLRKRLAELPADLSLVETFSWLRRHEKHKVVVILDQFEQWLHAHRAEQDTELVRALRQCDGGRLQALVMVRDDFSMAASRFMHELETRMLEGHNFATVDLFDVEHAAKVLTKFGQAFGKLPRDLSQLTEAQQQFIKAVASGLAEDGKVVSVRLALFAEMVKSKPWIPATLEAVGGTEGIGANFLEEMFGSRVANPEHLHHQKAARQVLMKLLPDVGSDIRGNMRSHQELLEASGYDADSGEFNELLRILDGKLRLITPTDPEGSLTDATTDRNAQFYQLTHDYLVPSLRKWLTRKQRESRAGRAQLVLAERSTLWNARQQRRYLPSWWEWATIKVFTEKKHWTQTQRKMMDTAGLVHGSRLTALTLLFAAVLFATWYVRDQSRRSSNEARARGFVSTLASAKIDQVPEIIERLEPYRTWVDPKLAEALQEAPEDSSGRLNLSLALLPSDFTQVDYLKRRLLDADADQFPVIRQFLRGHANALLPELWELAEGATSEQREQLLRVAGALADYDPDNESRWNGIAGRVVDALVQQNSLRLAGWINALRPARRHLTPSLGEVYRSTVPTNSQTEIDRATEILEDYARDDLQTLAELLFDAEPKQFEVLFDEFALYGNEARALLAQEIQRTLQPNWDDPPADPDQPDLTPDLVTAIERAGGIVDPHFAFCQTMPTDEFCQVVEAMRDFGYRPIRIRPFQTSPNVVVAAAWTRDDRDWRYVIDQTAAAIFREDERQRSEGLVAVDVAGYLSEVDGALSEHFAAVWSEVEHREQEARIFVGAAYGEVRSLYAALEPSGYEFTNALQGFRGLDGQRRFCGVISKIADSSTLRFNLSLRALEETEYFHEIAWDMDPSCARVPPDPDVRDRLALAEANKRASEKGASVDRQLAVGVALFNLRRDVEALEQFDALIDRNAAESDQVTSGEDLNQVFDDAYRYRAMLHARMGQADAANEDLARLERRSIRESLKLCTRAIVSAHLDAAIDTGRLEERIESKQDRQDSLYDVACAYAAAAGIFEQENVALSRVYADRAISLIRESLDEGCVDIERVETDAFLDPLRDLIGFQKLLESGGQGVRYSAVWNSSSWLESACSIGFAPEAHREKCREFQADDYRIASIGAAMVNGTLVTSSVWHRPLIHDADREALALRQANAAVAALRMGDSDRVWPLLKASPDPRLRSWIVHRLFPLGASPDAIARRLGVETDPSVQQMLILALGECDEADLAYRNALADMLLERYRTDPDAGIHAAAEWVLRRWGHEEDLRECDRKLVSDGPSDQRDWYLTKHGHTMVLIRGPVEAFLGSPYTEPDRTSFEHLHKKRIGRSYAIASKEVTVTQFEEFFRDNPRLRFQFSRRQAREGDCPQISVTWYEAAMYCRWLSEKEEIVESQMCYPPIDEIKAGMTLPPDYLSRTGYRLPTEAEWEYACRAKTATSRYYGDAEQLLGEYACYLATSDGRANPVARLKPNPFGLFDLLGNVQEWCQESYTDYNAGLGFISEDREDLNAVSNSERRLLRGGAYEIRSRDVRAASRSYNRPGNRYDNSGFRVVRTIETGDN